MTEKIKAIESFIKSNNKFKSIKVLKNKINKGLKKQSIIDGVNYAFKQFENIVVLEDDIITNKYYFDFMTDFLKLLSKSSTSLYSFWL